MSKVVDAGQATGALTDLWGAYVTWSSGAPDSGSQAAMTAFNAVLGLAQTVASGLPLLAALGATNVQSALLNFTNAFKKYLIRRKVTYIEFEVTVFYISAVVLLAVLCLSMYRG